MDVGNIPVRQSKNVPSDAIKEASIQMLTDKTKLLGKFLAKMSAVSRSPTFAQQHHNRILEIYMQAQEMRIGLLSNSANKVVHKH